MKVKEKSEKVCLRLNIQKTKIMASGSTTSWQIDGETVETVTDFLLGVSKITADSNCSHEIKRCLLPEKKVDAIQPSHPLLAPSSAFNLSQHQGLFHQVAKVFEFQLQHQSFQ